MEACEAGLAGEFGVGYCQVVIPDRNLNRIFESQEDRIFEGRTVYSNPEPYIRIPGEAAAAAGTAGGQEGGGLQEECFSADALNPILENPEPYI